MNEVISQFSIQIDQVDGFEFRVKFDKEHHADLVMDEPAPLGQDRAPNPARILAAAIGNCLAASLLFCFQKSKVKTGPIRTGVRVEIARNEQKRLRVHKVEVKIDPGIEEADKAGALRCLSLFEDYCTVTASIRQGIPVEVTVEGFTSGPVATSG